MSSGIMDLDLPFGARYSNTVRSFSGCWTCRLRRKKCDEQHPVCETCDTLHITCHYDQDKPEWMDGGVRQEEMAERLKKEVKEKAQRRRGELVLPQKLPRDPAISILELLKGSPDVQNHGIKPCSEISKIYKDRKVDCTLTNKNGSESIGFGRSDTIILMFYLEHLLPFLFPFYRPSPFHGGRAWILEMMISSPVVRQATLCLSSYFFSIAQGATNRDVLWETVLTQTRDAFGVLRQSLQVIDGSSIAEHLHGTVRIMASIIQVQRFEIAILSFDNCHAHLNASLALFRRLLDSSTAIEAVGVRSSFDDVMSRLKPPSWIFPAQCPHIPNAEQAAFKFSSTLLILDDIIASTVLQDEPRLYEFHHSLLGNIDGASPSIDLEATVGCQNWALLQIGEIAVLDAWKQKCKRAGNLDVMELVRRATAIKETLEAHLMRLETDPIIILEADVSLLHVLTVDYHHQSTLLAGQSCLVTRVWAHAALLYLLVVVSGWQPASNDIRYHVGQIIELLKHKISPPALLRTMVWPFCVAGCLAELAQEAHFRGMVEALQPPSIFGMVHKSLEIMEHVWRNRNSEDATNRDLATCFRSQGDLVLLV